MRIGDAFNTDRPVVSFEFFPPKTDKGFEALYETIGELKQLDPTFVSVTWGAGGSTRRKTVELTTQIQNELGLTAMAHLSCVGSARDDLAATLDRLCAGGVENVLALGGDRPEGYEKPEDGFEFANELIEFIRAGWDLCIGAACYPEVHPTAVDARADLEVARKKVAAGADFLITQLFFDNADYFEFVDRARAVGIDVPVVPGIMPVISVNNVRRMTSMCGARLPVDLESQLNQVGDDADATLELGVEWASRQCRELIARGAPGIHFYTLNRSPATRRIFANVF